MPTPLHIGNTIFLCFFTPKVLAHEVKALQVRSGLQICLVPDTPD